MDRESVERLRFDRRLARRRDWVDGQEVDQYIESLPDVSDKMTTAAELEAEAEADSAPESPASGSEAAAATESFGGSTTFGGGGFGGDGGGSGSSF